MTEKKSQLTRITEILERDGQITNFDAIHQRISLRLGARVHELRSAGWEIETKELPDKNTVYVLVSKPRARQLELV
jgi:hypothetical protein